MAEARPWSPKYGGTEYVQRAASFRNRVSRRFDVEHRPATWLVDDSGEQSFDLAGDSVTNPQILIPLQLAFEGHPGVRMTEHLACRCKGWYVAGVWPELAEKFAALLDRTSERTGVYVSHYGEANGGLLHLCDLFAAYAHSTDNLWLYSMELYDIVFAWRERMQFRTSHNYGPRFGRRSYALWEKWADSTKRPLFGGFDEDKHPRDEHGRFTDSGGGEPATILDAPGARPLPGLEDAAQTHNLGQLRARANSAIAHCDELVQEMMGQEIEQSKSWDDLDEEEKSDAYQAFEEEHYQEVYSEYYDEWRADRIKDFEQDIENEEDERENISDEDRAKLLAELERVTESHLQQSLPGMVPGDISEHIVANEGRAQEIRDLLRDRLTDAEVTAEAERRFAEANESGVYDNDDAIREQVWESLAEKWNHMDDDEKLTAAGYTPTQYAKIEEPNHYKVTEDGDDYEKSRVIAQELQARLTVERAKEMGIAINEQQARTIATRMWSGWKESSTSDSGLLLQHASAEELGGLKQNFSETQTSYMRAEAASVAAQLGMAGYGSTSSNNIEIGTNIVRAHIYGTWAASQYVMSKAGIDDMKCYRAVMLAGDKVKNEKVDVVDTRPKVDYTGGGLIGDRYERLPQVSVIRNGAASAAAGDEGRAVVNSWNGVGMKPANPVRVVLRIDAPREAIVSVPVFGQNVHGEHETVVSGVLWNKWDAWKNRAPRIEDVPIQ